MAGGPRRIVTNTLLMSAFKIGNPVEAFIQMIIHNFTRSSSQLCSQGFHMEITAILRPLTFDGGIHAGLSPDIRRQHGRPDCPPIRGSTPQPTFRSSFPGVSSRYDQGQRV